MLCSYYTCCDRITCVGTIVSLKQLALFIIYMAFVLFKTTQRHEFVVCKKINARNGLWSQVVYSKQPKLGLTQEFVVLLVRTRLVVCLFVCYSLFVCVFVITCLFVCLCVCVFVCLCVCVFVCLFVCLSEHKGDHQVATSRY